jgi:MFS family permease
VASISGDQGKLALRAITVAWLITSVYYFYQYMMRSAPAVMVPELTTAFGVTAAGLTTMVGLFYYGYAPFSLVAGVAMDQLGPRKVVPLGCALMGVGALLFATGDPTIASFGRFLQGCAGVFALIGAAYIATTNFPASRAATLIGATQMFGMAGGSAGQFLVGPAIGGGLAWNQFWMIMGIIGPLIALALWYFIPARKVEASPGAPRGAWAGQAARAMGLVFRNPQSIFCGLIAGFMFLPTTIFDMVWGVRFLQESHDVSYSMAVLRSASVPFGWIIGCPLLGFISDRIGRRKPVIIGSASLLLVCFLLILYGPPGMFPPYTLGLLTGIASGGAMIPYTVIKEANRPEHAGTATGVINFINFSSSAILGPVFGNMLLRVSGGGERELGHYQAAFEPLAYGIGVAILLAFLLKETGPAARAKIADGTTIATEPLAKG